MVCSCARAEIPSSAATVRGSRALVQIPFCDTACERLALSPQPCGLGVLTALVIVVVADLRCDLHHRRSARLLAGQRRNRRGKPDAVEVLHQIDNVAAFRAAATVPQLFRNADAEAINATAHRTRTDQFASNALESHTTTIELGFERRPSGPADKRMDTAGCGVVLGKLFHGLSDLYQDQSAKAGGCVPAFIFCGSA